MRLVFSVDVGFRVGFGHLHRCLAIAAQARRFHLRPAFDLNGDDGTGGALVSGSGLESEALSAGVDSGHVIVIDRVHTDVMENPRPLIETMAAWRRAGARLALIDAAWNSALRARYPDLDVDMVIAPYPGEATAHPTARSLLGPSYAPLGPDYASPMVGSVRDIANRILVTCGGSDPFEITTRVLAGLAEIPDPDLTVRVVIGPGFAASYRTRIRTAAEQSRHEVDLIESPQSLAALMQWSDLAVATSGMTKYELAATGTPAILLSPDARHARDNRIFAALGSCVDLGAAHEVSAGDIAIATLSLINDPKRRTAMREAGTQSVDGKGAARIAAELQELASS